MSLCVQILLRLVQCNSITIDRVGKRLSKSLLFLRFLVSAAFDSCITSMEAYQNKWRSSRCSFGLQENLKGSNIGGQSSYKGSMNYGALFTYIALLYLLFFKMYHSPDIFLLSFLQFAKCNIC